MNPKQKLKLKKKKKMWVRIKWKCNNTLLDYRLLSKFVLCKLSFGKYEWKVCKLYQECYREKLSNTLGYTC